MYFLWRHNTNAHARIVSCGDINCLSPQVLFLVGTQIVCLRKFYFLWRHKLFVPASFISCGDTNCLSPQYFLLRVSPQEKKLACTQTQSWKTCVCTLSPQKMKLVCTQNPVLLSLTPDRLYLHTQKVSFTARNHVMLSRRVLGKTFQITGGQKFWLYECTEDIQVHAECGLLTLRLERNP